MPQASLPQFDVGLLPIGSTKTVAVGWPTALAVGGQTTSRPVECHCMGTYVSKVGSSGPPLRKRWATPWKRRRVFARWSSLRQVSCLDLPYGCGISP